MTTTTNFFHALGAASLAVTISAVTLIATAGPVHAATTARVSYADVNLGTSAGRAEMQARVQRAARQVCDAKAGDMTFQSLRDAARCRRDAVAGALPKLAAVSAATQVASAK